MKKPPFHQEGIFVFRNKNPSIITSKYALFRKNRFGCMDHKEKFSFVFIMKQRDAGSASQKAKPFFVPVTTPRPPDTSRTKPYSVYLHWEQSSCHYSSTPIPLL